MTLSSMLSLASTLAVSATLSVLVGCSSSSNESMSDSAVSAVSISPDPCAVGHTDSVQLSALATFADGTKQDITKSSSTSWLSSDTSVATVDSDGNMVGVAGGTVTITASFDGKTGSTGCIVAP